MVETGSCSPSALASTRQLPGVSVRSHLLGPGTPQVTCSPSSDPLPFCDAHTSHPPDLHSGGSGSTVSRGPGHHRLGRPSPTSLQYCKSCADSLCMGPTAVFILNSLPKASTVLRTCRFPKGRAAPGALSRLMGGGRRRGWFE